MTPLTRRDFVLASASAVVAGGLAPVPSRAAPAPRVWTFDNLGTVGGRPLRVEGAPKLVEGPGGPALAFDGRSDALFIDEHPLAGAATFTFEAVFRPDGGAFEQRWFHLESDEQPPAAPGKGSTRMLFEIRVVQDAWYLDAFMTGPGYRQAMMVPEKLHPVGRWYHVAQTYDGSAYRSFVDGELQMEVAMPFTPQGPGRAAVGVRMNRLDYFHGAIREARFTHAALPPAQFSRPSLR